MWTNIDQKSCLSEGKQIIAADINKTGFFTGIFFFHKIGRDLNARVIL